jgi:hypothetical protein
VVIAKIAKTAKIENASGPLAPIALLEKMPVSATALEPGNRKMLAILAILAMN